MALLGKIMALPAAVLAAPVAILGRRTYKGTSHERWTRKVD